MNKMDVHQTYHDLIIGYTGVTLVEYAIHLSDVQGTLGLMERVLLNRVESEELIKEPNFKADPVFQWATSVMRKKVLDALQPVEAVDEDDQALQSPPTRNVLQAMDLSDPWHSLLDTTTPMSNTFPFSANS